MARCKISILFIFLSAILILFLAACNAPASEEPVRGQVEVTPAKPTSVPEEPEEIIVLDLCTLLTEDEVAQVLGLDVTSSDEMGVANCTYTSSDPTLPYSVSVSSAQGIEAKELNLVGIQLLLAFAPDPSALESISQLVENAESLSVLEVVQGVIEFQDEIGAEVSPVDTLDEHAQWIWNPMGSYGTLMWVEGDTYLSFNMLGMEEASGREYAIALAPLAKERLPAAFTVSTTGEFGGGFTFEYSSESEPSDITVTEPDRAPSGPPAVWVTNSYGGTVSHIDPETNTVVSTIDVGKGPHDIVANLDTLIISNSDRSSLIWIDPVQERIVQEISLESGTHLKLSLDEDYLYVGAPRWGSLQIRELATGDLVEQMVYANCWDVEVSDHGLWLISGAEQELIADLSLGTWEEANIFEPGGSVSYIKFYKGYYWLGVRDELHKVLKVDAQTYEIVAEVAIDAGEQYMSALGVGENGVWVGFSEGMMVKIDPVSVQELLRVWGMENPVGIVGGYGSVWVTHIADDAVARLDPETLGLIAVISVDTAPYGIALNP
jgi:YVTN family beta-propeller protein